MICLLLVATTVILALCTGEGPAWLATIKAMSMTAYLALVALVLKVAGMMVYSALLLETYTVDSELYWAAGAAVVLLVLWRIADSLYWTSVHKDNEAKKAAARQRATGLLPAR